jgi:alanyl-tRNA synthetase
MLTAQSIVAAYRAFCERENLPTITPSPVVNEASKTSFNYSLEEPILRKFGTYFNITEKYRFGTIQPCIRTGDFANIKAGRIDNHLTLFHILPVSYELSPDRNDLPKLQELAIKRFFRFVCGDLGLDQNLLHVIYFGGGKLETLCKIDGHTGIDIPPDEITYNTFRTLGLKDSQLERDTSPDTYLVSFSEPYDFYAGYRFELYFRHKGTLIEIGTGEALNMKQRRDSYGITYKIETMNMAVCPIVVGLERLLLANSTYDDIFSCDHIKPLLEFISKDCPNAETAQIKQFIDSVRTLHAILADVPNIKLLNSSLRERVRAISNYFADLFIEGKFNREVLSRILRENSALQPWSSGLTAAESLCEHLLITSIERRMKHGGLCK